MVGARARDDLVDRRFAAAGGRELLQPRFRMLGCARLAVEIRRPGAQDEALGGLQAAIDQQRPDQRLDDVADDILAEARAILARLFAEPDQRRDSEVAADVGAGLACDQGVVPPR